MKNTLKILLLLLFTNTVLISCAGDTKKKSNANFLPPLEIEITEDIKNDTELVGVVKSSEKAINEFSNNIEQLLVDGEDIFKEDFNIEEASLMEKVKAGKLFLEFGKNSTQMLTTMEKFNTYVEERQTTGDFNESQIEALKQVGESIENRMKTINKKYEHYFDK